MSISILDTNVEKLKKDQLEALKEHFCKTLDDIKKLFLNGEYQKIFNKYLEYSAAGYGWGNENYFINFSWHKELDDADYDMDIYDILELASKLSDKKLEGSLK